MQIQLIRNILKKPETVSVAAAMGVGSTVHLFGLVNVLHNYDDIAQQPRGYGTGITSGRWLLSLLGDFSEWLGGNYNLAFVNGLLFLALIACSSGLLISVFCIKNCKLAALAGILFAVFPSAFSTLVFRYTSVYYGIGILLSVMAAWILPKHRLGLPLSAVCIAGSLGIYQAYIPITIGVFVLQLLQQTMQGRASLWQLIRRGLYYCLALVLGLCCYFLFLNITLRLYGTSLSDYQGVDQMGKLALQDIPALVWEAFYTFCTFPLKNHYGLASMKLIMLSYIVLAGVSAALISYILLVRIRKISLVLFAGLLCLVFPVAVNFVVIMCPESWIYTLMVYAFVLTGFVPIVLLTCLQECSGKYNKYVTNAIVLCLMVLIGAYSYKTNVNYNALYFSNRQVENYLNSMIVQIRMADGFNTDKKWAFLGDIEDPLLYSYWQYEMEFGGIEPTQWMVRRYSWGEWVRNYYGYTFPVASDKEIMMLCGSETVKKMPCWPNDGAVAVIGDFVVIKCAEQLPDEL